MDVLSTKAEELGQISPAACCEELIGKHRGMLVDCTALLSDLDKPDPDIDRVWVAESQRRWKAYKAGKMRSVLYKEVMKRLKKR